MSRCRRLPKEYGRDDGNVKSHGAFNVQHTYDREKKLVEKYDVSNCGTGGGGGEYRFRTAFG